MSSQNMPIARRGGRVLSVDCMWRICAQTASQLGRARRAGLSSKEDWQIVFCGRNCVLRSSCVNANSTLACCSASWAFNRVSAAS